jgi:trehalose 6-phosphate synthase/phosphatase
MRLLIVSNRLPVVLKKEQDKFQFEKGAGGLVSGLSDFLASIGKSESELNEYVWMGWPGTTIDKSDEDVVRSSLEQKYNASPVFLSQKLMDKVYLGFCNKTIWPIFHYFPNFASFETDFWSEYTRMNEIFCEELLKEIRPDDIIWVHDYHLMLLPALLREKVNNPIGFFLHIPFPSYEMYKMFSRESRSGILEGLLGADLIGFHTHDYSQYFLQSVLRILGIENHMGYIELPDRMVKVGTFPMGIEFEKFNQMDVSPFPAAKAAAGQPKMILSVDRLDYSKGIINRLQGFELFLKIHPEWRGKVFMNMIVVPSRTGVPSYQKIKRTLDELVGNVNGNYSQDDWTPVVYQYTSLPHNELIAKYRKSDVALLTPLRDGMNLVAKEYIASLQDRRGVLVLSEFTGAAKELSETIIINPNSIDEIATGILEALEMPEREQIRRNKIMQKRLKRYDVTKWAYDFVDNLINISKSTGYSANEKLLTPETRDKMLKQYNEAKNCIIIVNYDGTLVPISKYPGQAKASDELLRLLTRLHENDKSELVIISSRGREDLDNWLGGVPVNLTAEHGSWIKHKTEDDWQLFKPLSAGWKHDILPILELYADRLPGSFVEEREYSVTWNYKKADIEQASVLSKEISEHLMSITGNVGVQVLHGNKVIEISNSGVNKGELAMHWLSRKNYDFILAIGAGWSDELLFQTLPDHAWSVKVGFNQTAARYLVKNQKDAMDILEALANQ